MNIFPANVKLGCKSQRIPYFVALKRGGQLLTLPLSLKIKAKQFVTGRDIYGHDSIYRKPIYAVFMTIYRLLKYVYKSSSCM